MTRSLLFFYGTLMSGHRRGSVLQNRSTSHGTLDLASPVARGSIRGDLYDVGGGFFPCFVTGDGVVYGEVWECPSPAHLRAALSITDVIEGFRPESPSSSLYVRETVPLLSVDGAGLEPGDVVQTYRYVGGSLDTLGAQIRSGDWRAWSEGGVAA